MNRLFLIITLFCCSSAFAQRQNVSGIVSGPDGGIAKVSVREIDSEHRIYNHTTADRNGLFTFRVRDAQHSLQFYAPGYRTLSHKMLGAKSFKVTMEKRRTSPYVATAKVILKSERLFCGHYLGEVVRQQAWMEKMNDTLFTIILPVQMERAVDEYPAGRQAIVLDELGRQVMQLENVVDVYPIIGDPDDVSQMCLAQSYTGVDHVPGVSDDNVRLYAYPHFQVSRSQLEQFCNKPELLGRLAVDTYRATNYWNFFPTDKTIELLRSVLENK
ncbi:MAG: carboxypeptidase regulatory-like domain-containing protein [Bacteroidaceae bacterium]|nr:carboxypeptidase regulatory-like domain-containing protein [Bacteroidaceae bacterium]